MTELIRMPAAQAPNPREPRFGIGHWMERVLAECDKASRGLAPDPVHDLRVALRRCRSLADGMRFVDPDTAWKKMRRAGKLLFSSLGELRDAQVMMEWVLRLGPRDDPASTALKEFIAGEESRLKKLAAAALQNFDRKQWEGWIGHLAKRANRLHPDSLVFRHIALERWMEAYQLHRQALRNRTQNSYHQLRIGIKRFRYTVENFLPTLHESWEKDLKELQDALGEIHDLDVLWATAVRLHVFADERTRLRWQDIIEQERNKRIEAYRGRMLGKASLWRSWRAALPKSLGSGALVRLKTWSTALDPDPRHARHVARLAVGLYDRLCAERLLEAGHKDGRTILEAAGLMHEIGRGKTGKKFHKVSCRMIRKLKPPAGWTEDDLLTTALVVRHHRGTFLDRRRNLQRLSREQCDFVLAASSILRLADALDCGANQAVYKLRLNNRDTYLEITVPGGANHGRFLERIARARYPLEALLNRPVFVRLNGSRSHPGGQSSRN
jgi:CHAD domain-containing protein